MNKIRIFSNKIIDHVETNTFCKKRIEKDKCLSFFNSIIKNDFNGCVQKCPYGYSCVVGLNSIYCGFVFKECADYKKVKNHIKYSSNKYESIEIISKDQLNDLIELSKNVDYCAVCSETIHELIHFCGQLRTLIEVCKDKDVYDERITSCICGYSNYINAADEYIRSRELIDSRFPREIDLCELHIQNDYYRKIKENYIKSIDEMNSICEDLDKKMKDFWKHDEEYKKRSLYYVVTLFAMQSLFSFRLRYHRRFINELTMEDIWKTKDNPIDFNAHRVAKKISNTLWYQAINKSTYIKFAGNSFNIFHFENDDIILAVYILLENAVKYSLDNTDIILTFSDVSKSVSTMSISNVSSPVGDDYLPHIMEKGVSGDNSKSTNSSGLGLHIVKRILDANNVFYTYKYENEKFTFFLKFQNN